MGGYAGGLVGGAVGDTGGGREEGLAGEGGGEGDPDIVPLGQQDLSDVNKATVHVPSPKAPRSPVAGRHNCSGELQKVFAREFFDRYRHSCWSVDASTEMSRPVNLTVEVPPSFRVQESQCAVFEPVNRATIEVVLLHS